MGEGGIVEHIIPKEIHAFHIEKAFAPANQKIRWRLWEGFGISGKVTLSLEIIKKGEFSYTFDAIVKNDDRAIFINVLKDAASFYCRRCVSFAGR